MLKKKSVAKAKIFFLLIFRSTQSCYHPSLERPTGGKDNTMSYANLSEESGRRLSLTDRNWSIAVGLGKILAETHPQACVSSRKFGEKTAKLHRLRELPSRGPSALVLYTQKHTQNAKINLSRPSRKGVDRGCGPHYSASG